MSQLKKFSLNTAGKLALLKFGKPANPESPLFYRASPDGVKQLTFTIGGKGQPRVILVPMRSLSQETFTFPFSSSLKVQTALKLRVMPWSAAGGFEIFPVTTGRAGRGVNGIAWYVSPGEFERLDALTNTNDPDVSHALIWPAALPFVSAVEGTGVTIFADAENLCSILWQNDLPILNRWRPRTGATPESELEWFDKYCTDQNLPRGMSYIFDTADGLATELEDIAKASIARCPWLLNVNLSRSALEGARDLERSIWLMTKAACWIFLMGALVLGGNILRLREAQSATEAARTKNEAFYRQVFEPTRTGRISNPVTLARDKIAEIRNSQSTGRSLGTVLTDLGSVFASNTSMDVAIDILRYNTDGMDCTGLAPDMTTVLNFRKAWEERASLSQLDNTQNVSNAGYRFDLRVRWQDQPR